MVGRYFKEELLFLCEDYWNNIKETFNLITHAYKVVPAESEAMKCEAYKIRHKVYCAELNYEDSRETEMEEDAFDNHSSHMVIFSRTHKAYIGCARLIHGRHQGVTKDLPFEHHCESGIDLKLLNSIKNSGYAYAEVSRLAIEKNYRNKGQGQKKQKSFLFRKRKLNSFALITLYLGIQAIAKQQGVRYLFAIVEPRLLKNLHNHNIPAIQIGKGVDHRGLRVPIMIDVEDIERIIPSALKPVYNNIIRDVRDMKRTNIVETSEAVESFDTPEFNAVPKRVAQQGKMAQ